MKIYGSLGSGVRFTRRFLDWRFLGAVVSFHLSVVGALASCSDGDDVLGAWGPDAAADTSDTTDTTEDAGGGAITRLPPDAATSDAGPRSVVCEASPCATSLTTTLGRDREGYCALLEDGRVACWGDNRTAELGRGETLDQASPIAAPVVGLSNITFLHHTCAIDKDGATWCWGTGPYLRDPSSPATTEHTPVKLPIPPATMVAVNWDLASNVAVGCAVVGAEVLCWGTNKNGQIAQVDSLDASSLGTFLPVVHALPPGAPIKQLAVGTASLVLRNDGTLLSWGATLPLGRMSSLAPSPYAEPIALSGVSGIDVGHDNACAVAQGIAYCWGSAEVLGSADWELVDPLKRALPSAVPTPEPLVQIDTIKPTGNAYRALRACAVGVSGDVYCWGGNTFGQAGDGTKEHATASVKVVGLPAPAVEVKTTPASTCALLTTGKIFCWGDDYHGQLGNGKRFEPSLTPIEVQLPCDTRREASRFRSAFV